MNSALLKALAISLIVSNSLYAKEYPAKSNSSSTPENLKGLSAACAMGTTVTEISLNNVRTWVHQDGLLWSDISGGAGYEVPKGSGKSSIYSGGVWIGGTDVNGQLKLSGIKYKNARNFWPGPLLMEGDGRGTTDVEVCYQYDRHYEITRYQVDAFRQC